MFTSKRVLVTGGTGLIGRPLVEMLVNRGAHVTVASLDEPSRAHPEAHFRRIDLTRYENCLAVCEKQDFVFHLAAIKGSPAATLKKPASFFVPTILLNTNVMEAARRSGVQRFLYTSTIGVYPPAEVFREDDVWTGFPSPNDKFAGWAKRMGELQAEAYAIEYGWDAVSVVRPANVFGPFDNFHPANAMVIPSLVRRAVDGENPLVVWGDGSSVRDFIHASDVARGMILVMEKGETRPVNLASGSGYSIREIVEIITENLDPEPDVVWDSSKPGGDRRRVMDVSRARSIGFVPQVTLKEGIRNLIAWYSANRTEINKQYNIFAGSGVA